ncbi:MAG: PH domain-containing protein [Bacteroides sp.]|nr:PH domain-containing protein [Roseburia sp.]MCM1346164.1 PH domain-containing protein [Bacteroides sp.]MCM1420967.1 PH domain-containing protein [Bacteroides sp.]
MNRVFQAKINIGSYILLFLLLLVAVYSMWNVNGILLCVSLLLLVIIIERMIHTTYTVTSDGMLVVNNGRFSRRKEILLGDIQSIERIKGMRICGRSLSSSLLIVCKNGKLVQVTPANEDDFVKCVQKRRK